VVDRVVFGEFPIRGILIVAAIGVLASLGYSAASNGRAGPQTVAAVTRPTTAPVVVAANSPTPAPSSEAQRTPTPAPPRPTEPAATPQGDWFFVKDVTPSEEDSTASHDLMIEVTSAQFGALSASTASNATCGASGTYPSGAPIVSDGLGETSANSLGLVRWRFSASPAEHGRAAYLFTCSTGSNRRTLEVLFDIP
jgi:hypothetical protein